VVTDLPYPVVAIVPGVGFDERGVRLGRGLGFYDRALNELRRNGETHVVGVAFEPQIVSQLPYDVWDEAVDVVVSELRVIAGSGTPGPREASACS
jgi:5-formyltetrahydrofolate cyclo-ligase